ncbi:MAG TPA: iron-sulfur cluster repair di-iron protein [Edaphocola sp.]|nr:iron-sulfur cluster repair di-iron protein [Edaphocola sp.]
MTITKDSYIGNLVVQDYRLATIFKRKGIDFCCKGNRTLEQACLSQNVDLGRLIDELQSLTDQRMNVHIDFDKWPVDLLADYIEKTHHRFVRRQIKEIESNINDVLAVHSDQHPELSVVAQLFQDITEDILEHLSKEEFVVFPYIRKMVTALESGTALLTPFGTIQNPIRMMLQEHEGEGDCFRKIAAITNYYQASANACPAYKSLLTQLEAFDADLQMHIHLENNILFPKSIAIEAQLQG